VWHESETERSLPGKTVLPKLPSATLLLTMLRQARFDAPGTLHHVMVRGPERRFIFRDALPSFPSQP